jgi:hypothetical protein
VTSSAPKKRFRTPRQSAPSNVFINCPFDAGYRDLFRAVVFTVIDCGFKARCALEFDDGSEVRMDKIERLIGECRYGIHDLSRTELDPTHRLPRFNMPLELGLFLGAKRFGGNDHKQKNCLILDIEQFRYQKFISDLGGQDVRAQIPPNPSEIFALERPVA